MTTAFDVLSYALKIDDETRGKTADNVRPFPGKLVPLYRQAAAAVAVAGDDAGVALDLLKLVNDRGPGDVGADDLVAFYGKLAAALSATAGATA